METRLKFILLATSFVIQTVFNKSFDKLLFYVNLRFETMATSEGKMYKLIRKIDGSFPF